MLQCFGFKSIGNLSALIDVFTVRKTQNRAKKPDVIV